MTIAYRPFSDFIANEALSSKLITNIEETIISCKPISTNKLSNSDLNSLRRFIDQIMGKSLCAFLDYYENNEFDELLNHFRRSIDLDSPGLEISATRPLRISSILSIFCLNNVIIHKDKGLFFDSSVADVIYNDIASITDLSVFLKKNGIKQTPLNVDYLSLAWLSMAPGYLAISKDNTVLLPKALDDVYHHHCRVKCEQYYDQIATNLVDDIMQTVDTGTDDDLHNFIPDESDSTNDDPSIALPITENDNKDPVNSDNSDHLKMQREAIKDVFDRDKLLKSDRFRSDEHLDSFLKSFEVDHHFVSSIKRNATILVLGLRSLLENNDDPKATELLEELLEQIVSLDSSDHAVINSLLLVGAFEAAFSSSLQASQAQLSTIPDKLLSDVSSQINAVADEAGTRTKSVLNSMKVVMDQTQSWGAKMTEVVENYNSSIEEMPKLMSEKFDQAMQKSADQILKKSLSLLHTSDEKTIKLQSEIDSATNDIKSFSKTAQRKTIITASILVPLITIATIYFLSKIGHL